MKNIFNIVFTKFDEEPTIVSFTVLNDKVIKYLRKEEGMTNEQIDTLMDEGYLELDDNSIVWLIESNLIS